MPARAVRPTRWMYSFGSSGGSNWMIQSTAGMSRPRAATRARGHVGAQHDPRLGVDKLEEGVGPLLLLLAAVKVKDRNVHIVEQLRVETDAARLKPKGGV